MVALYNVASSLHLIFHDDLSDKTHPGKQGIALFLVVSQPLFCQVIKHHTALFDTFKDSYLSLVRE